MHPIAEYFLYFFSFTALLAGLSVAGSKRLISIVTAFAALSLSLCVLYLLLDAPDVALTEAADGAAFSGALLWLTAENLQLEFRSQLSIPLDQAARYKNYLIYFAITLFAALLLYIGQDMPEFGGMYTPLHSPVSDQYLLRTEQEIGVQNVVSAILAVYRGVDTLGEVFVIVIAGMIIASLLPMGINCTQRDTNSAILRASTAILTPILLLFATYVLTHGTNSPGGGFQAGVLFATAGLVLGLVTSKAYLQRNFRERTLQCVQALAVLCYPLLGLAALVYGKPFLTYSAFMANILAITSLEICIGIAVAATLMRIIIHLFPERPLP